MRSAIWTGIAACAAIATGCSTTSPAGDHVSHTASALADACTNPSIDASGYLSEGSDGSFYAYVNAEPCADGQYPEYAFTLTDPHGVVMATQDYGLTYFEALVPMGSSAGTYTVTVSVRPIGAQEPAASLSAKAALGAVCRSAYLSTLPGWVDEGGIVTLEPFISCDPEAIAEWQVVVTKPNGGTLALGWQTGASIDWDTTGVPPGEASLALQVRNLGNVVNDLVATQPYTIGEICSIANLAVSGTGTVRNVSASAGCYGAGTAEYRFTVKAPNGSVSELRGFDTSAQFSWDTSLLNGRFEVTAEVRGVGTPTQPLSTRTVSVNVGDACTTATLADTWGVHLNTGTLPLVASTNCQDAEYRFQTRALADTSWTTACAYSTASSCNLALANLPVGDYLVRAQVRKLGSIAEEDTASAPRDFVVSDGGATIRLIQSSWGWTAPIGLSADGRWVVGNGATSSALFRWSRLSGFTSLGKLSSVNYSTAAQAQAVSDSGNVVVGWDRSATTSASEPFRWAAGAMVSLKPNSTHTSLANGVSADGTVVVGSAGSSSGTQAFRWTAATGLLVLGDLPGGTLNSSAADVSGDGSVLVGSGTSAVGTEAVRWTAATGMVSLGDLPGGAVSSSARAVSRDGNVVVGQGTTSAGQQAFRWTQAGGMVGLGLLSGTTRSQATGVSQDGNVVIGASSVGSARTAFIWTPATGMLSLKDVLLAQGAPVADWTIEWAADISADGKTIIGTADIPGVGNDVGFLAMLP